MSRVAPSNRYSGVESDYESGAEPPHSKGSADLCVLFTLNLAQMLPLLYRRWPHFPVHAIVIRFRLHEIKARHFGMSTDPGTFLSISVLALLVALLACSRRVALRRWPQWWR